MIGGERKIAMSFIEFKDLSHVYHAGEENEHRALAHITFNIEAGEFVVILGTNGSGKSTLAKHINGLLLPTAGKCLVNGLDTKNPAELWQIRQQAGMVFQNPDNQLIAALVEDDVAFGPENLGLTTKEIRPQVDEALKAVGMEKFKNVAPHLLSGGQKQRVAIAGALAMKTRCLILDEPTAMLDPKGRLEVIDTIKKLHKESGITVILITHFMEEAVAADKMIIMKNGQLAAMGKPRELFARVEYMKELGLAVPLASEVGYKLRQQEIAIPADIMTDDELAAALEALYGN